MEKPIIEKAYAKINLALDVKEKRKDNYHNIDTIMAKIDLFDELTFFKLDEAIIAIDGDFFDLKIEDNFIYKAAKLFLNHFNIKSGVNIVVKKNIPVMAGLAGGSADASATLRGLNRLFKVNAHLDTLSNLSSLLGSDMPYCVYQTLSRCQGRGEIVNIINLDFKKIPITLIKPKYGTSTKLIYKNYVYKNINKFDKFSNIILALTNNNIELLKNNIFNDLMDVAFTINNDLFSLYKDLSKVHKVFLSGSGPTLFILDHNVSIKNNDLLVIKTYILQ